MKRILSIKGSILLAAAVVLLAVAVTYAAQGTFDRTVTARWQVLVSGDIAIEVYEADGTTRLTDIDFGTSFVDLAGNLTPPTRGVVVKNLSTGDVKVIVTGDGADDVIPLFGPTTGDLKSGDQNAFVLKPQGQTGDTLSGYLGLTLLNPTAGSKTTTIILRAASVGTGPIQAPAGMVGWWPGDGNANDIVGQHNGTLRGDATFAPGMVGQAFNLDGDGDWVELIGASTLGLTDSDVHGRCLDKLK